MCKHRTGRGGADEALCAKGGCNADGVPVELPDAAAFQSRQAQAGP